MKKKSIIIAVLVLVLSIAVFAAKPNPGHSAEEISGGTFSSLNGSFNFMNNVGIGTTTPLTKLAIMDTGSNVKINVNRTDGSTMEFVAGNTVGYLGTKSAHDLNFIVGGSNMAAIDTSGNFGVGTMSPAAKLDVNGSVKLGSSGTTCDASHRGEMRFSASGAGSDDLLYICMKNSADSYNWVLVARGG